MYSSLKNLEMDYQIDEENYQMDIVQAEAMEIEEAMMDEEYNLNSGMIRSFS